MKKFFSLAAAVVLFASSIASEPAKAQELGQQRWVPAIRLNAKCGNDGSASDESIFNPPPGWVVVEIKVLKHEGHGNHTERIDQLARESRFESRHGFMSRNAGLARLAGQKGNQKLAAVIAQEESALGRAYRFAETTHQAIVGKVWCKGKRWRQGGYSRIEVDALLVYVGTPEFHEWRRRKILEAIQASGSQMNRHQMMFRPHRNQAPTNPHALHQQLFPN